MGDSNGNPVYRGVPWLKPADRPLLVEFATYGRDKWLDSRSVSLNVHYSRDHVSRRCRELHKYNLLEKHPNARASYRITELGERYIDDELDDSDLLAIDPRDETEE